VAINPLKILGTVGKGLATIVGVGGAVGGATTLAVVPPDINETLRLILEIITAVGVLLASFGIGRKARDVALKG
jgi:hypothetical protein